MSKMIIDAQAALGFVLSQTTHVETAVNETIYPDIQYPSLIPVDTSAHSFAQTVTYYSSDKLGKAGWINGNADDVPLAGSELTQHKTAVHTAGIGYAYGWEEINHALMLGINLTADDAKAARRAYEEMVDGVALRGDTSKGFKGLINSPDVTAGALTNGNWAALAAAGEFDKILADVNNLLLGVGTATAYTTLADTLLLSMTKMNILATTRLGDTTVTLLEFIRKNNTYTAMTGKELTIRVVIGLETAGAASVDRMVAYRRSPDVLKLHIPMPHQFLPAWQAGPLRWEVPGVFRLGGLDIRRPKEVRYGDGA